VGAKLASERGVSASALDGMHQLHGMIGVGINAGGVGYKAPGSKIPLDCDGSAKSVAQIVLFVSRRMPGRGIAFGSDLNGLGGVPKSRFGPYACEVASEDAFRSDCSKYGNCLRNQIKAQVCMYPSIHPSTHP